MTVGPVTLVTPVYGNEATLEELHRRVVAALDPLVLAALDRVDAVKCSQNGDTTWALRMVVDASPDHSLAVALRLAEGDPRVSVLALDTNVGQHAALLRGLAVDDGADAWVCLDADLQDPPEAVPALLDRLAQGDVGAVFGGRRGAYETRGRLLTGALHRVALARLTGLPADAGAFVAMDRPTRDALVALDPPSIVAGIGVAAIHTESLPVERPLRPSGRSAWTTPGRVRQAGRTLAWAARRR